MTNTDEILGATTGLLAVAITADIASKVLGKTKKLAIKKSNSHSGGKFKW